MMARAIALSRRGFPAPNPHVGCVIVQEDEIVGEGFHDYAGGPHAEVVALGRASEKARGATAYMTLEPCNHHGRTPPCVDALLAAGIKRVVTACADPITKAGGPERLQAAGVEFSQGLMEDKAREANLAWLTAVERGWPYVVVKAAMTLDGKIATPSGESKWITGEKARREGQRLRAECGAVLVGRGTIEADNPRLTVRDFRVRNQPTRIVLDPHRKLGAGYHVFDQEAPSLRIVTGEACEAELSVADIESRFDLPGLLKALYKKGITSVLVEGGADTIGSFMDAGLVDRLDLFVAGKVFGSGKSWVQRSFPGPLESAIHFELSGVKRAGEDVWLVWMPTDRND